MFNARQLSFILSALCLFFVLTDTSFEHALKVKLWSFWGVTISEGSTITSVAPTSLWGITESGRENFVSFLGNQNVNVLENLKTSTGPVSALYYLISIFLQILKFLVSFVIIFYPLLLIILYFFFTSSLFRRRYDY